VTVAQRPSWRAGTGRIEASDLPDGTSEIFFADGLDMISENQPVGQISCANCSFAKDFGPPTAR
jgi:hypothetical protein